MANERVVLCEKLKVKDINKSVGRNILPIFEVPDIIVEEGGADNNDSDVDGNFGENFEEDEKVDSVENADGKVRLYVCLTPSL